MQKTRFAISPFLIPAAVAPLLAALAIPAQAQAQERDLYLRYGLALEWSENTRWHDADCAQTQPPALFGCGMGIDQEPLGAQGDFDQAGVIDLGLGYRLSPNWRVEAQLSWREGLDFSGQANFLGVSGAQPVEAEGDSLAALLAGYLDLPALGPVRPFIGLGVGLASNSSSRVHYHFPGLGAEAATATRGERENQFAWQASLGASMNLRAGLDLDLAWRYTDLDEMQSAAGDALIVRQSGTRVIDVGATAADLETQGVSLSLRYAL